MAKKLWGGRFKQGLAESAIKLSYSLHIDKRLVSYDIAVNTAHAKALQKANIFTKEECQQVCTCLSELNDGFIKNEAELLGADEDIHSCIERLVTERLGDLGKRLHTGKSRNDQVITDTRLFIKDQSSFAMSQLTELNNVLCELADEHKDVIFPGFTHFQPALPVLFSHHILAYIEKFKRDISRFEHTFEMADVCALGSGAMAGNNYGLDRDFVAKELGFSGITQNSMDAVSDRDFILEYLFSASVVMTHLSRFCEEIVVWNSPIIGFVNLGDDFTTGSSIMPQKKNPDMAELIRGKSGRVLGNLVALQQTLKGLPLTYNRDLQEDKEMMFDTADTLSHCLDCFTEMMQGLTLNKEAIHAALSKGYLLATDFADYLVKQGVPFRDSHEITGKAVLYAMEQNKQLEELSLEEFKSFSGKVESSVYDALTLEAAVNAKDLVGGTAKQQVHAQITKCKAEFN